MTAKVWADELGGVGRGHNGGCNEMAVWLSAEQGVVYAYGGEQWSLAGCGPQVMLCCSCRSLAYREVAGRLQ